MKIKTLAVMLLGALLFSACVQMPDLSTLQEQNEEPAAQAVPSLTLDVQLPISGEKTSWKSADYQGKPILIAVMATWCPWCKKSLGALEQTSAAYAGKAEVVGLFVEKDMAPVEQVKKDFKLQSKILYNGESVVEDLGVRGFPHIMLFDKNHKLVRVWSGYSDTLAEQYAAEIDKLLK